MQPSIRGWPKGSITTPEETTASVEGSSGGAAPGAASGPSSGTRSQYTIRAVVDEVAQVFPSAPWTDGDESLQRKCRSSSRNPNFLSDSGLLVDTSGSVPDRFKFEKQAVSKLVQRVVSGASDLGFVAGFFSEITVAQDFTADTGKLSAGLEKLTNGGGTRLFDTVSFACSKLAAYPEQERVARVLVVWSDGEDNSSHRSLKQSIQDAEKAGVTGYMVGTKQGDGPKTDADKIVEALAERSGGEAMFPGDAATLGKTLDKLGDLIRSRYLIAYNPAFRT